MRTRTEDGRLIATASAEFVPLVEGVGFIPHRVDGSDTAKVRTLLDAEGAVILPNWPAHPEGSVRAAVLGTRLRWLEALRERCQRSREPRWDEHDGMLGASADLLATLGAQAPRERLAASEILVLDNYRCPHGVDVHDGERRTYVLRCRTVDAL